MPNREMDNTSDTFRTDTNRSKKKWFRQRLLIILCVIGILILCVAVGLAVRLNQSQGSSGDDAKVQTPDNNISNGSYAQRLERANQVLGNYPLVDGHNDLAWQYRRKADLKAYSNPAANLATGWSEVQTDIPRIRKGKLGAQFWSAFVHCNSSNKDAVRQTLDQFDIIKKFVARYPNTFEWVTTAQGIEDAFLKRGKVGSLIGLEGGHSIDSSLGNLRMMYELGVRYMTVTHSCNTPWADNWMVDEDGYTGKKVGGLTNFGKVVIKEMNRLGMMIDLSHVSKKLMEMALDITLAPVIYSHSSAFEICNHYRNVQDDVLQKTKANGGVVMVNFYSKYINCYPRNITGNGTINQVAEPYTGLLVHSTVGENESNPRLLYKKDHIDHIKNLIGIDYVGIGGDYDGVVELPNGLEDVSTYPALFAELVKRGYSNEDLMKLAGKNVVRVFREVEKVREDLMKNNQAPYEDRIMDVDPHYNETEFIPECRTDY